LLEDVRRQAELLLLVTLFTSKGVEDVLALRARAIDLSNKVSFFRLD
jgi:hypothetical protein